MELIKEIEVNIVHDNKVVETTSIDLEQKYFEYDNKKYDVDSKAVFLYPSKDGFIPTVFYKYGNKKPLYFKDCNEGIPARALHLLWNHTLYRVLVALDKDKTNLIIILLLIANAVIFGIRMYLLYVM